jgi:hypothetical protein
VNVGDGKTRVCGKPCHTAKKPACVCWCAGMFHGAAGAEAREAFQEAYGPTLNEDPTQRPLASLDNLRAALERRADELGALHVREPWHRWTNWSEA